jgi:hypothetical protein
MKLPVTHCVKPSGFFSWLGTIRCSGNTLSGGLRSPSGGTKKPVKRPQNSCGSVGGGPKIPLVSPQVQAPTPTRGDARPNLSLAAFFTQPFKVLTLPLSASRSACNCVNCIKAASVKFYVSNSLFEHLKKGSLYFFRVVRIFSIRTHC